MSASAFLIAAWSSMVPSDPPMIIEGGLRLDRPGNKYRVRHPDGWAVICPSADFALDLCLYKMRELNIEDGMGGMG